MTQTSASTTKSNVNGVTIIAIVQSVIVVILSISLLVIVVGVSNVLSAQDSKAKLDKCVRDIAYDVNDQRWNHVYGALDASVQGDKVLAAQEVTAGKAFNGVQAARVAAECEGKK